MCRLANEANSLPTEGESMRHGILAMAVLAK